MPLKAALEQTFSPCGVFGGGLVKYRRIKGGIRLVSGIVLLASGCVAQTIPSTIWGKWIIQRELPTRTIACWGDADAKKILGTQIAYSDKIFRWNRVITNNPTAEARMVTADEFGKEESSPNSSGSQVDFRQLGIIAQQTLKISIHHDPADITGATDEIPGDNVLVKDSNTIVFSVCNIYFEAKRVRNTR